MGPDLARAASEALWLAMIDLAEEAHGIVVLRQASAGVIDAKRIGVCASDLAALADAARVLARHAEAPP